MVTGFINHIITHLSKLGFETDEITIHYFKVTHNNKYYHNTVDNSYMGRFVTRFSGYNSIKLNNFDFQYNPSNEEALISILKLIEFDPTHCLYIFKIFRKFSNY